MLVKCGTCKDNSSIHVDRQQAGRYSEADRFTFFQMYVWKERPWNFWL